MQNESPRRVRRGLFCAATLLYSVQSNMSEPKYKRLILKLSGESFAPPGERGINMTEVVHIARQTIKAKEQGVQIAIVIGGGNILRGAQFTAGNSTIHEATA